MRQPLKALTLALAALPVGSAFGKDLGTFSAQVPAAAEWLVNLSTLPAVTEQGPADPGLIANKVLSLVAHVSLPTAAKGPLAPLTAQTFEARMPDHDHGMVTRAKITEIGPDEFRIDGVKLHMPGAWELTLRLTAAGQPVTFVVPVKI